MINNNFSDRFNIRNSPLKTFELFQVEKNYEKNFIILESLNYKNKKEDVKNIYIIYLNKNFNNNIENHENIIKIGRNNKCDMVVKDISISRVHSEITLENNGFFLRDNFSKFGTLVLLKRDIEITEKKLMLQIGRTLVKIEPIERNMINNE